MKKLLSLYLTIICLLFTYFNSFALKHDICSISLDNVNNALIENYSFGTYNVTNGWIRVEDFVSSDSYLYCANGEQTMYKPNNILVKYGTNRYSLNEIQTFAESINFALKMQSSQMPIKPKQVIGGGSFTSSKIPLISFNIEFDDGTYQKQYYIVKDYGYVMVSEMVNHLENSSIADSVAQGILDSFRFN